MSYSPLTVPSVPLHTFTREGWKEELMFLTAEASVKFKPRVLFPEKTPFEKQLEMFCAKAVAINDRITANDFMFFDISISSLDLI